MPRVRGYYDVRAPAVLRTTFEDHSPRQAVASCKTHCLFFFIGEDTLVNTHFAVPILRAPLLTDTRWSTVGPGTREDFVHRRGGVHRPVLDVPQHLLQWWRTSQWSCSDCNYCSCGGAHHANSCCIRSTCSRGGAHFTSFCNDRGTRAGGGAHRTSSCCNRSTCAKGGVVRTSSGSDRSTCAVVEHIVIGCSDRSTCASDGVRHISTCRDCSTCAVVEYIVPALTVIAPALACGVLRNCGNRSIRMSVGELRGCSRSQLLLQWWNTLCQSLPCLWRQFKSCSQRQRLWQSTSGQCLLSQRRPLQLCA